MTMTDTTQTTTGWIIFVAAMGMMMGMVSVDIVALKDFQQMSTPLFVGTTMGHISAVIGAFIGGKLIPTDPRNPADRTRTTDPHA